MLKRNQYFLMLLIGIIVFIVVFIGTYFVVRLNTPTPQNMPSLVSAQGEKIVDTLSPYKAAEETKVTSSTSIQLVLVDKDDQVVETQKVDALALVGCNEAMIKQRFSDYELKEFTKDHVVLKRVLEQKPQNVEYSLGVQEEHVCIVEKGNNKTYTKLDLLATQFSKAVYSAFLKEEINITDTQKEKLLSDATYIETILQYYEGE